ncbi:MAG TPA: VCBS repeat-containing protein, partial [Nannocystaceae bacterium]|nr:VCBS repeat-containing protein [Nannocystaceae bacterium]
VAGGLADPIQGSLGDIDCDGDLDLAAGGVVYRNDAGSFGSPVAVDGAGIAHLADMNGDGQLDLVTHDASVGLALYLGDGAGAFTRDGAAGLPDAATAPVLDDPYGIDVGDLDGNDSLDIVRIGGFAGDYRVEAWVR